MKPPVVSADELKQQRRAARQARRLAQRAANVDHARLMHQFRIAYQHEAVPERPKPFRRPKRTPELLVGCSGWYYWHWDKIFYPSEIKRTEWFGHYADNFTTVELNAPFYSWPKVSTIHQWLRQAAGRPFVYTVKVSELITHVKRFTGTKRLVKDFGVIADLLGPHMGCFLFQLPPSFRYTPARLRRIAEQLDPTRTNVVEFRHASWWNRDVYRVFRKAGISFCSCSGPRLPDELIETTDDIYVRFHGTTKWYRHDYTRAELAIWTQRICQSSARRVWAYFNNDRDGFAIKNARMLQRLLVQKSGVRMPAT